MKNVFVLFVCLLVLPYLSNSQNNMSASLGMGLPELANLGFRYEMQQTKFGISMGTAFTGDIALSGDIYYHFAGSSGFNTLPPWYLRANLTWWHFGKILFIDLGEAVLLGFRIGRDFNISENIGISIDGGIIPLTFLSGNRVPFSFIPSAGISIYYRLRDFKGGRTSKQ